MRKKELLTRIAHKTGKKRDDVRIIVEELIAEMKETMISGENIYNFALTAGFPASIYKISK